MNTHHQQLKMIREEIDKMLRVAFLYHCHHQKLTNLSLVDLAMELDVFSSDLLTARLEFHLIFFSHYKCKWNYSSPTNYERGMTTYI